MIPVFKDRRRNTQAEPDRILTVHEVAELLRVPVSWVYDHARVSGADRLPHFKLGKYLRFKASEIGDWLKQRSGAMN